MFTYIYDEFWFKQPPWSIYFCAIHISLLHRSFAFTDTPAIMPNRNTFGSPPPTLKCSYCPRYFKTKSGRTRHIQALAKHPTNRSEPHAPDTTPQQSSFYWSSPFPSPFLPSFHDPSPIPSHFLPSFHDPSPVPSHLLPYFHNPSPVPPHFLLSFHDPSLVPSHMPPSSDGLNDAADPIIDMDIERPLPDWHYTDFSSYT